MASRLVKVIIKRWSMSFNPLRRHNVSSFNSNLLLSFYFYFSWFISWFNGLILNLVNFYILIFYIGSDVYVFILFVFLLLSKNFLNILIIFRFSWKLNSIIIIFIELVLVIVEYCLVASIEITFSNFNDIIIVLVKIFINRFKLAKSLFQILMIFVKITNFVLYLITSWIVISWFGYLVNLSNFRSNNFNVIVGSLYFSSNLICCDFNCFNFNIVLFNSLSSSINISSLISSSNSLFLLTKFSNSGLQFGDLIIN